MYILAFKIYCKEAIHGLLFVLGKIKKKGFDEDEK